MNTAQPIIVYPDSSTTDYSLSTKGSDLYRALALDHGSDVQRHWNMLSSVTASASDFEPLLFIKTRPHSRHTAGSSLKNGGEAFRIKYTELAGQLKELETKQPGDDLVETGAVHTAALVIEEFSRRDLAPPELSWIGSEAIIMLWILGDTKYALTVTDGELGYVVRAKGKTLRTAHSIPVSDLDVLQIT